MSRGREKSPEITLKQMSANKQKAPNSQNKPRTILDRESAIFKKLYAERCQPGRSSKRGKVRLSLSSSLPPEPSRATEQKSNDTSRPNQKIIVDYSDDDEDDDEPSIYPEKSKNKFAVKRNAGTSINLLETTKSDTSRRSPRKKEEIKTINFYNSSSSPLSRPFSKKTYSRVQPSNGRIQKQLPILKINTKPSVKLDTPETPTKKRYPPYSSTSGIEEFKRRGIHIGRDQVYHPMKSKYKAQHQEMETIDLLGCEEINVTPPKSRDHSKESTPAKHASSETTHSKCEMMELSPFHEFDIEPDFNLDYDDDDLPPLPTIEDEPMDCTQEDSSGESLRMEIRNIYFGSLSCKPLDNLEITPELFKLHIQFTHEDTIFKRILNITRENIKVIELNTLISSGFIIITPKPQFYNQLSIDLQLIPTFYLNQGDSQYFKTIIIINFNNKTHSINSIFCKLEEWYGKYISVKIDEKNNYKLLGHDGEYSNSSSLEDNGNSYRRTRRDSLIISNLNSPTVSQSITVSSESPPQEESSLLPEIDHSYTSKGGRSHHEPVIEEYFQLIESEDAKLLTFPEAGYPGRITIPKDTIKCLQPEIFLNDTIIEFYLHYIQHQLQPKQKEQVHIFNTFFYTKLTNNLGIHLTAENTKTQHSLVSKWTKNVDLFTKDFILVPIHDHAHWFLAIICYPCMAGKDPIIVDEDISVLDSTDTSKHSQRKRRPRIEKKACILIFDSLNIQRNTVTTNLRFYLQAEWNARHPSDTSYKCSEGQLLVGHHPKLPVQPNSWDCGLFLMQYAESFLSAPPDDFNFPLKLERMFSLEEIKHKRNQVIKLIFDLSRDERYSIKRV